MENIDYETFFSFTEVPDVEIARLKREWKSYTSNTHHYFGQEMGTGQGIVTTAGGLKYFTSLWILVNNLRDLKCTLPVEVWFHGNELTPAMQKALNTLNVECRDLKQFIDEAPHGFLMKPLAIIYSSFQEVLFIDSDNVCVKDPTYLFDDAKFKKYGCLFWPDFWHTKRSNPIWQIIDVEYSSPREQESGQILIDKKKSWNQLQLCIFFNMKNTDYSRFMYGDKDTFRFAWLAMGKQYFMIDRDAGCCGYYDGATNLYCGITIVQHDPYDEVLFLHRNMLKWDITLPKEKVWRYIKVHAKNAITKKAIFRTFKNDHNAIDLLGEIEEYNFESLFPELEEQCLKHLNRLRSSKLYRKELFREYLNLNRFN